MLNSKNEDKQLVTCDIQNPSFGKDFVGVVVDSKDQSIIGKKIFVPYTIDGEKIESEILEDKKSFFKGTCKQIIEQSEHRIKPRCPYFTHCGGCHYQHIAYDYQLKLKKKLVKEFLNHNLKININEIGEIPYKDQDGFNYRKRAVFHIDENKNIGFFKGETREVVDIESCNILSFSVLESFKKVKEVLKNFKNLFYLLVIDDDNEAEGNEPTIVLHLKEEKEFLNIAKENDFLILRKLPFKRLIVKYKEKEIYKNFTEDLASGHFSQVNKNANNALIDFVTQNVTQNNVLELYAGSGNFSFPLANKGKDILAVELDSKLVDLGKERAKKLNLENKVRFVQSSCEKFVKKNNFSECIILDPPRSGAKEVVKYFNTKDTKEIIYISCNLASLQRDLKILEDKGFTIKDIRMLDMFPQTYHMETVVVMSKVKI